MKKILFTVAIVLSFSNSYGQNLLKNGSFEEGQQSWKNYASDGSNANFSLESNDSNSLKIDILQLGSNAWDIQSLQSFASEQGKKYILKLKAKAENNGSKIRAQVQKTTYTSIDLELTTDWKEYTWNFESKEDNLELALHEIIEASKKVSKTSSSENLIPNGDFEKGTEGWINLIDNGANAIYTINEDNPYEGKKSLRALVLLLGSNAWDVQSISNFASVKGIKYKLTFMAKADSFGKKLKAQVQDNDAKIYIPRDYELTEKWQEYSWVFRARTDNMQIAFQYLETGLYEIDSLSVKAIPKKKKKKKIK